jgi:hypothetical protein
VATVLENQGKTQSPCKAATDDLIICFLAFYWLCYVSLIPKNYLYVNKSFSV